MSNVLPFPPRNKGRVRKTRSVYTMGRCALSQFDDDKSIPANVADIRMARPEPNVGDDQVALHLALAIFAMLNKRQKQAIRRAAHMYARHEDGPRGDIFRVLHRYVTGDRPC